MFFTRCAPCEHLLTVYENSAEDKIQPIEADNAYDDIKIDHSKLPPFPRLNNRAYGNLLNVVTLIVFSVCCNGTQEHIQNVVANLFGLILNAIGSIKAGIESVCTHTKVDVTACAHCILNGHIFGGP